MKKLDLTPVKRKLESMRCPEHNQSPIVIIRGEKIEVQNICCDAFKRNVDKVMETNIDSIVKKHIDDSLKDIFK